jgi:hypothetical protein
MCLVGRGGLWGGGGQYGGGERVNGVRRRVLAGARRCRRGLCTWVAPGRTRADVGGARRHHCAAAR